MTCSSNKQVVYCIILHVSNSKMFKKQLLFVFLTLKPLVRAAEESLISAGEKNTIPSSSLEQIFLSLRRRDQPSPFSRETAHNPDTLISYATQDRPLYMHPVRQSSQLLKIQDTSCEAMDTHILRHKIQLCDIKFVSVTN